MLIFIYGPPASGKTTVGRLLANRLNLPFTDLDVEIERQAGKTIPQIFAEQGEPAFRRLELDALQAMPPNQAGVIALGGGALLDPRARAIAEQRGAVLCLGAPLETLTRRLHSDRNQRPLLAQDSRQQLAELLEKRSAHYASFHHRLENNRDPHEVAWEAQIRLGAFHISGMGNGYDVRVQPGGLATLGEALQQRELNGPIALVSDETVGALYAQQVAAALQACSYAFQDIRLPAGEPHKTIETVNQVWNAFLQARLERRSTAVAMGGGVTGDLVGFAAATYLRSIPWVNVPTTLLAMVDSSLGGKTGANLPQGKNLIGAFHAPRLVLADPLALATLPESELRNGLAETIKHGVIGDPQLFAMFAQPWKTWPEDWFELVSRSMAVKVKVIEADPYEQGLRQALNLGHTLAHGLEIVSNFQISHGQAVAIGTAAEAHLSERIGLAPSGLAETIQNALQNVGLPSRIPPELDPDAIRSAMALDKKKAAGKIKFALPVAIGRVEVGVEAAGWERLLFE